MKVKYGLVSREIVNLLDLKSCHSNSYAVDLGGLLLTSDHTFFTPFISVKLMLDTGNTGWVIKS